MSRLLPSLALPRSPVLLSSFGLVGVGQLRACSRSALGLSLLRSGDLLSSPDLVRGLSFEVLCFRLAE